MSLLIGLSEHKGTFLIFVFKNKTKKCVVLTELCLHALNTTIDEPQLAYEPGLDWPLCHRTTDEWLTIVPRYDGTLASRSLI